MSRTRTLGMTMTEVAVAVGPVYVQAGLLFLNDGTIAIDPAAIAGVERHPFVAQSSDAWVKVHLVGGQTITVFFGAFGDADERSDAAYKSILAVVRTRTATRLVSGVLPEDER